MSPRPRALPPLKLARPGHRSHVGGTRRLLGNRKRRSALSDALHADAAAIMRRLVQSRATVAVLATLLLAGCESSRTVNGRDYRCLGINGRPSPDVSYEFSTRNIALGAVFSETIVVPIVVAFKQYKCPIPRDSAGTVAP